MLTTPLLSPSHASFQLCGTGLASACGFGNVFEPAHEASARRAVLANNTVQKPPFEDMQQHLFDGDTGTIACSYPHGRLGDGMRRITGAIN